MGATRQSTADSGLRSVRRLRALRQRVESIECRVSTVGPEQGIVGPALDDPPGVEIKNQIRDSRMAQVVGDEEGGASLVQPIERLKHGLFVLFVQTARGLVKNQNGRRAKRRPRDGDALSLPVGECGTP